VRKQVQVIPLSDLLGQGPLWWRICTLGGRVSWHWWPAFAIVQFLVGGSLLLFSINPGGMSYFLILAGFSSALTQCFPEGRANPIVCLLTTYVVLSVLGFIVGFPTSFP
jgi:hypothetical protein